MVTTVTMREKEKNNIKDEEVKGRRKLSLLSNRKQLGRFFFLLEFKFVMTKKYDKSDQIVCRSKYHMMTVIENCTSTFFQ